jgi:quinoprotein glucose dehydrogenase
MTSIRRRHFIAGLAGGLVAFAGSGDEGRIAVRALAQPATPSLPNGAANGEWRTYGGDLSSTRYTALDQINRNNFNNLQIAWRFKTDAFGPRPEINFESTPLMANGVIYCTVGSRRDVVALDASSGELLWSHREDEGKRGEAAPRRLSGRGLAYWSDGRDSRILYVTPGYRLIALDAKTGALVSGFGKGGIVDLKLDDDQTMDLITGEVGLHAAPVVARNIVLVGAAHLPGGVPKSYTNEKGYLRAFDVRTGRRLWIFHTIPRPGEFGNDTWEKGSWEYTGNTGVWGQMSVDENLGMVYVPVELPTGDYYGGHRPGKGLFGETLVALDLNTGKRKWHYQLVHHGIWDMDIPDAPILLDITVNGKAIKAVAQPTKQGWLYVFDRVTGQPVWPIDEKPVAQGDVPGEWYSPTQPFPSKPAAYDRQGVSLDDLIDFTPELKAEGQRVASRYKIGPIFTPPVVSTWPGPLATLMLPSSTGGANWPGGSFDPETKMLYVYSATQVTPLGLVPGDTKKSEMRYVNGQATDPNAPAGAAAGGGGGEGGPAINVQGLPLVKPPYGRITAFDMNKGDMVWQIAHGDTPDNIKNHPALRGMNIPRTGRIGRIGTLVTKTLVVAGEAGFATTPNGRGAMLRAYDKVTGNDVGAVYMPAPQTGSPMTYMLDGKQYILLAISGAGFGSELIAYKLP